MNTNNIDKNKIDKIYFALIESYNEKKSFEKVRLSDIAKKANIPLGEIYANFNDKDEIAIQFLEKLVYDVFTTFDEDIDKDMPLSDKLNVFLGLQLEFITPNLKLIKEILPKALLPLSKFAQFLDRIRRKYINFLSELFLELNDKADRFYKVFVLQAIVNSFMLINISLFKIWENDKSENKKDTLKFIEKSIKNFVIVSGLQNR